MYPRVVPVKAPPGERTVFEQLKNAPGTQDWIVLHSLELANHERQLMGELDFVVIIPRMGVLCVEVKSHEQIAVEGGEWLYGPSRKPGINPFQQANAGTHTLRKYVAKHEPSLAGVPFRAVVVFPHACLRASSPEWEPEQVIDQDSMSRQSLPDLFRETLVAYRTKLAGRHWFDDRSGKPDRGQCEKLLTLLRPSFEVLQSPSLLRKQLSDEVLHYTAQQMEALDAMADNPRVLFSGAAGTGKTVLALEAARRSVLLNQRTLLVCFNQQLGEHLKEGARQLAEGAPGQLHTSTLHSLMQQIVGRSPTQTEAESSVYWEETLPEKALERLVSDATIQAAWQFDYLVVDEAQDLLRPQFLDVLDLCISDGLARGRWLMFGDFAQSLYNNQLFNFEELHEYHPGLTWVPYKLTCNCRNTPRIGTFVQKTSQLQPGYARHLRPDDHTLGDPVIAFYHDDADQLDKLAAAIEKLLTTHNMLAEDIVVLSFRAGPSSAAGQLSAQPNWRNRFTTSPNNKAAIRYATIHSFKGLEASAIIVTDITSVTGPEAGALFYVAASRASNRLIMLADESTKKPLMTALL
jgi:DNA polymerase III delta prime subunit